MHSLAAIQALNERQVRREYADAIDEAVNAHMTREEWLDRATEHLRTGVFRMHGGHVPPVKVSVGWPSVKGLARANRRVGECWDSARAADGLHHLFISPVLSAPVEVLAVLAHELVHATVGTAAGHKAPFKRLATSIGLEGKMTATVAGPALTDRLNTLASELGPYPHGALTPSDRRKQTTRLRLWTCGCGTKVRLARDEWHATCNECSESFNLVELEG